jgi:diguanylate cyclase (GGDEF)-like protein
LQGAANLAEKLRRLVEEHHFLHCKHLTISLGASVYRDGDASVSLVERADASMYRAKRGGRNRVEVEKSAVVFQQLAMSQSVEFTAEITESAEKFI